MSHRTQLLSLLEDYRARSPAESVTVERFVRFVEEQPRCFERELEIGHVTGSAWIVDPPMERVLLTHHRKLGRWLQLGGHADGDPDMARVARREAVEESGLDVAPLSLSGLDGRIFDVDIHVIPERRTQTGVEPEHEHFDVRFALRAATSDFVVSAESLDLAWVAVETLDELEVDASVQRMAAKWREVMSTISPS